MLSTIWEKWFELWTTYGAWIGAGLVPTIITGLSLSPKTEKAIPILQKAWEAFKQFMAILSFLTHKDQPGTFKLPLKLDSIKKDVGPTLALLAFLAMFSNGCGWWSSTTAKNIKEDTIDCTVEAVENNASSLLPVILAILTGNFDNWKTQLAAITKEFGAEAVACSLDAAAKRLQDTITPKAASDDSSNEEAQRAIVKARLYLTEQHWNPHK